MGQVQRLGRLPRSLGIRRMAAQCVIARLNEADYYHKPEVRERITSLVEKDGLGGICVFAGSLTGTANIIADLQRKAKIPLMIAGDFEHGLRMRLDEGTAFPHALALGKSDQPELTQSVAEAIAREMSVVGIHWNFAPVVDIFSNPLNPVINIRSFGENAELVSRHARVFIRGLQNERVLACAKHFPGHGDTSVDSHLDLPVLTQSAEELREREYEPFRQAIEEGVKSIMVGHLAVPSLDPSNTPASLSPKIVQQELREKLDYQGLIVTDALDMKAITRSYDSAAATLAAIKAGADVALLPEDPLAAIDALEEAIRSGEIPRLRMQDSVERILEAKKWAGAIRQSSQMGANDVPQLSLDAHRRIALEASAGALEWYGRDEKIAPLDQFDVIAGFALVDDGDIPTATRFFRYLSQCFEKDCHFAFIDHRIREDEVDSLVADTADARVVILPVFARAEVKQDEVQISGRLKTVARKLAGRRPSVAVLFGNPHVRHTLPATAHLCVFSNGEGSLAAAARELTTRNRPADEQDSQG